MIEILKIGIIAYDRDQCTTALREISNNDISKIKKVLYNSVVMEDGNEYIMINSLHPSNIKCLRLDQLIIVDDPRWNIFQNQCSLIHETETRGMSQSFYGMDCQILKYEW